MSDILDDPNASHPLDLLINAISGTGSAPGAGAGDYQIPQEARGGEGEFNLEQLLNSGSQDDGLDKVGLRSTPTVCHIS